MRNVRVPGLAISNGRLGVGVWELESGAESEVVGDLGAENGWMGVVSPDEEEVVLVGHPCTLTDCNPTMMTGTTTLSAAGVSVGGLGVGIAGKRYSLHQFILPVSFCEGVAVSSVVGSSSSGGRGTSSGCTVDEESCEESPVESGEESCGRTSALSPGLVRATLKSPCKSTKNLSKLPSGGTSCCGGGSIPIPMLNALAMSASIRSLASTSDCCCLRLNLSLILPQALRAIPAVGVGEVGLSASGGGGGGGGARPEDCIGSEDPVRSEAAVAAAATLETS